MSNGDGEDAEPPAVTVESRLDDAEADLAEADAETALDDVESTLADIETALEDAEFPEPDDEDEADPAAALEDRLESLRTELADKRGPYVEDVAAVVTDAAETLGEPPWTKDGAEAARDAVAAFLEAAGEHVTVGFLPDEPIEADDGEEPTHSLPGAVETLEEAAGTIADAGLDPDEDEAAIAALLAAAETLGDALEDAEVWSDLSMRDQLEALGFYEVLAPENRIDFPPEWSAMKSYGDAGNVGMLLAALEKMGDADFMVEYVFEQLRYLGRDAAPAYEELHRRAEKRNTVPIELLGKIADERACETLHEFVDPDAATGLQKTTLRALGEIGSRESTQPVANRLDAEEPDVRSAAARALGLIGDTRAIEPLADALDEDEADEVRASAAWALCQIGTERALDAVAPYADDRSYIVQAEAEKAAV